MNVELENIIHSFRKSRESVTELAEFDKVILDFAIEHIRLLTEKLKTHHNLDNPHLTAEKTLILLQNIRSNDSLRVKYEGIFNQCIVLLVSHFSSTVRDLFQKSVSFAVRHGHIESINREEIKLSLGDIKFSNDEFIDTIGGIVEMQKDVSFQDMKSISRVFSKYFDCKFEKDENVNNIIMAQACRHAIVHAGAKVDERLIKQVENAAPRSIKENIVDDKSIVFVPSEINTIAESMEIYLSDMCQQLDQKVYSKK